MNERWELFPSISDEGDKLLYLKTENFYNSSISKQTLESSELIYSAKNGSTLALDKGIILRPEISSDGNFARYQKIVGEELGMVLGRFHK